MEHGISTDMLGLQKIRDLYKKEGIAIDLWQIGAP